MNLLFAHCYKCLLFPPAQNNELSGNLPAAYSSLSRLSALHLANNNLQGPLPLVWPGTGLQYLLLDNNNISGPLPDAWGDQAAQLAPIVTLTVDNNALSGPLPVLWSSLGTLRLFSARNNSLSQRLDNILWSYWMPNLVGLALDKNQLTGSLPPSFSMLSSIQALSLGSNQLEGQTPDKWSVLTRLENLNIANNQLTWSLPSQWDNLVLNGRLINLWLFDNANLSQVCFPSLELLQATKGPPGLTGSIFETSNYPTAGALSGTALLGLDACPEVSIDSQRAILLAGKAALDPLNASSLLSTWNSSSYPCDSATPRWGGVSCNNNEFVRGLSLASQGLTGTLPTAWSRLVSLQSLDFSFNTLRGSLPGEWSTLSSMVGPLLLRDNSLTGSLPEAWGSGWGTGPDSTFDFAGNSISGTLPAAWSIFMELEQLVVDKNQITGSLPAEWNRMTNLRVLSLAGEAEQGAEGGGQGSVLNDGWLVEGFEFGR